VGLKDVLLELAEAKCGVSPEEHRDGAFEAMLVVCLLDVRNVDKSIS
jgi:hypothetical protein